MATWLKNELPEEWPDNDTTSNSSVNNSGQGPSGTTSGFQPTVAIQRDKAQEAQWKQAISPAKANADHLNGLFENQESEFPIDNPNDTSASGSDLSSIDEQTRRLKLFTQVKNTYTNQRLDALATSLQGHDNQDKSDIIGNLMNDGNNALSRIRKASNLELRAVYEHSKEDSSLDDLNHLDNEASNGSTLSSLTDRNTTSNTHINEKNPPYQKPNHQLRSLENLNPTVRFKTPSRSPEAPQSQPQTEEVASLAIPESSEYDLEEKPFMSFAYNDNEHIPLTTSASETSGTAIRPPAHQVRRDTMIHNRSRPPSTASQKSADPRPYAQSQSKGPINYSTQCATVRHRPSRSTIGSMANINSNKSIDKVFDVSINMNTQPLRDISLPRIDEENTSIARKNVSFSGSLYTIVQQVRSADNSDVEFEIDLSNLQLECIRGLDEFLPNLAKVNLSCNNIQVVDGLSPSLLEVDLSYNHLNRISAFPLSFITMLNISHNNLEDLSCLKQLRVLNHLDVSHNDLSSLKGIDCLYSLQTLNIDGNKLKSLKISHPKLQHLRASNNQIEAVKFDTPSLETLDLDNNKILSLDSVPSVQILGIRNNDAKLSLDGWSNLQELYYDGNNTAKGFGNINSLIVSWEGAELNGFDPAGLSSTTILTISSKTALKSLSACVLPIQQLNLVGMNLKSLPSWLPRSLPYLRCLNLAFNQLDDASLHVITELKSLRTLGLFGNRVSSLAGVTLCLAKLPSLGALDLRGNPVTNALYPDMKTLLMNASMGSPYEQYDMLLDIDWNTVLDEWQAEPVVSNKFNEYNLNMKSLKLWWLDGATIDSEPPRAKMWTHSRAHGLGALAPLRPVKQVPLVTESVLDDSRANITEEFDMRHHFQTPSQNDLATPSRVHGEISTIGKVKAKAAKAMHSTPGLQSDISSFGKIEDSNGLSTPQTINKESATARLAKNTSRARKTPVLTPRPKSFSASLFDSSKQPASENNYSRQSKIKAEFDAKLTAEFIVALCRKEYNKAKYH